MFPLVGVNLNQWLVCAVLLRSVAFFHSGSAEAKCPLSFSFCLNLHSRSYPEFGLLCCLLSQKKKKKRKRSCNCNLGTLSSSGGKEGNFVPSSQLGIVLYFMQMIKHLYAPVSVFSVAS